MDASIRQSTPSLISCETDLLVDHRRPDRAEPDITLVPLPRSPVDPKFYDVDAGPGTDQARYQPAMDRDRDGNVVKGILFGLMLSMPFWLVTAFVSVMILR